MSHNAARIRTLSVSAIHSIELAESMVPQMAAVTRLEITDLDLDQHQPMFQVDHIIEFVKSHRMLFGPILTDISIVGKSSPLTSSSLSYPGTTLLPAPLSPSTTFESTLASLSSRLPTSNENIKRNNDGIPLIFENLRNVKSIDATEWADCILHLDSIIPVVKSKTTPNGTITNTHNPAGSLTISTNTAIVPITTSIKKLWLSFNFPPSQSIDSKPARLSEVLERCRNIEQVRVPIRRSDVFTWAMSEKKTSLICAPILANSKTKQLPKIKRLHLHGPVSDLLDCVHEAAFAFQDTLEDLEAQSILRVWQPTVRVWEGYMVNLKRLKLDGEVCLYFSLDSLKQCPALEELSLSLPSADAWIYNPHDQSQYLGSTSNRNGKTQPIPSPLHHQAITRISELKRLRSLTLVGAWVIPDTSLRRIADHCRQLTHLCLNQVIGMSIGGLLLGVENMCKLEALSLTLDIVDLHLVRVVIRPLINLKSVQLTNLGLTDLY
ncbi:hypothetical protein BGZ76_001156 [Entomortierella beljakovae]|nr:hypothetical protein BGZ76_001156 [Entomortierella beljakovae]